MRILKNANLTSPSLIVFRNASADGSVLIQSPTSFISLAKTGRGEALADGPATEDADGSRRARGGGDRLGPRREA